MYWRQNVPLVTRHSASDGTMCSWYVGWSLVELKEQPLLPVVYTV